MSHEQTKEMLHRMVAERDWGQFHTPENLAKSIAIEGGELLECYQWDSQANEADVRSELADVLTYCFLLADALEADVDELVREKLSETCVKYPVELAKGRNTKYDRL
jgi:dCTP diphosphatase